MRKPDRQAGNAIALANRIVGRTVELGGQFTIGRRAAAYWRQGPDAKRVVRRVGRIGIDLGRGDKFESGLFRQGNDIGLLDIAVRRAWVLFAR